MIPVFGQNPHGSRWRRAAGTVTRRSFAMRIGRAITCATQRAGSRARSSHSVRWSEVQVRQESLVEFVAPAGFEPATKANTSGWPADEEIIYRPLTAAAPRQMAVGAIRRPGSAVSVRTTETTGLRKSSCILGPVQFAVPCVIEGRTSRSRFFCSQPLFVPCK